MPGVDDDRIEELRADGVELVAGSVTDLAGVTRAKYVPLRRLGDFQRAGMGVSPSWSVFCVDSGIAFTPTIGVAGDLRIRIDPADVRRGRRRCRLGAGYLTDQQGDPAPLCVRSILAARRARPRRTGLDRPARCRTRVHDARARRQPRIDGPVVALRHPHLAGPFGVPRRPRRLPPSGPG